MANIWVPINARNAIDENLYIMNNNRVEALFYHSDFEPLLDRIRAEVPSIRLFVCIDRAGASAPHSAQPCKSTARAVGRYQS